jgi:type IV secretion system protein VirB4
MLQLDEASSYVEGGFVAGLEIGLRKYRKLKTQVVFATQSVLDLANSSISHIILNSCPTQIFVQDSAVATAKGVGILNTLGLTEDDAQVIAGMAQAGEYFVHRPGVGKAVVSFDLATPIASRTVLMTDDDHYRQAAPVEARAKRNGTEFLDEWMAEAGIDVPDFLNETIFGDVPMRMAAE